MDFSASKRKPKFSSRSRTGIKYTDDSENTKYQHNLSFYNEPPGQECSVSLKDFEDYAVARLKCCTRIIPKVWELIWLLIRFVDAMWLYTKLSTGAKPVNVLARPRPVLRAFEKVNLKSVSKYSPEWKTEMTNELERLKLDKFIHLGKAPFKKALTDDQKNMETFEARKFDHISHFIFRLAFCRNDELKRALIAMELDFFHYKFMGEYNINEFLESQLKLKKLDEASVKDIQDDLTNCNFVAKTANKLMDYYEVDFTEVIDLVRLRRVFLKKGTAYVPYTELISMVTSKFRKELSQSLSQTAQIMPMVLEDERLSQILTDFDKRYTGTTYTKKENGNAVTAEMLPELSKTSFPLCMKGLHDVVEKEHHVKHFGRLQLGLFFKAVGLPLDEAIIYWRSNFTKKAGLDGTRFDKQYLYNIRHMYGKEGKRADYTPYSCMKIIMGNVGPGEHHGCPFRHSDATPLREKLVAAKIPSQGITEILDLVKNHHYQIACQKYFEWTHDRATVEGGIQHPNQYFEESQKANLGLGSKAKDPVKKVRVSIYGDKDKNTQGVDATDIFFDSDDDDELVSQAEALTQMDSEPLSAVGKQSGMESQPILETQNELGSQLDALTQLDTEPLSSVANQSAMETQPITETLNELVSEVDALTQLDTEPLSSLESQSVMESQPIMDTQNELVSQVVAVSQITAEPITPMEMESVLES